MVLGVEGVEVLALWLWVTGRHGQTLLTSRAQPPGQAGWTRDDERTAILARSLAQQLVLLIGGRIERGLRDGGRRAGPSHDMSGMDGRALRASAITPDGRHPGRTARQPFWPFCGRAARRISMHSKWQRYWRGIDLTRQSETISDSSDQTLHEKLL